MSDGQQPPRPRPPTLFEKSQLRSLFALIDQVALTVANYRRNRTRCRSPRPEQTGGSAEVGWPPGEWEVCGPPLLHPPWTEYSSVPMVSPAGISAGTVTLTEAQRMVHPPWEGMSPATKRRKASKGTVVKAARKAVLPPPAPQWLMRGGCPQLRGGLFTIRHDGVEVCFTFAKNYRGACPEPCLMRRAHVCQVCLGPHTNRECPHWAQRGKGGKGGKGRQETRPRTEGQELALALTAPSEQTQPTLGCGEAGSGQEPRIGVTRS